MITFTKEQLIASAHARIEFAEMMLAGELEPLKERTWSIELELARIALASLEAKPIGAFHIAEQQVDGTSDYLKDGEWPIDNGIIEVYAAPPVPVVPEEKPMPNPLSMYAVDAVAAIAEVRGWNACRAAMLHGTEPVSQTYKLNELSGNSPVIPGEVLSAILKFARVRADFDDFDGDRRGIGDCLDEAEQELIVTINKYASQLAVKPVVPVGLDERAAFNAWNNDENLPIAGVGAKNAAWLAWQARAELGHSLVVNYPVTPDSWISCSERMPDDGQHVIILCDGAFVLYAQYRDGEFFDIVRNGDEFFETQSRNVTDWMRLPEPPQ